MPVVIKKIILKEVIREDVLRQSTQTRQLTQEKYTLDLRMKDRVVVVNKAVVIPFESISYIVVEGKDD